MADTAEPFPVEHGKLLDAAPDAMIVVDRSGRIVFANRQTEAIFGHPRETIVGGPVEVLIPESKRAAHEGHRAKYESDPRVRPMGANLQLQGLRKGGAVFPVEISLSPLRLGHAEYTIAAIRDTTERVRATEAQRRLATVVESSVDGIVTKALDGTITSWNPGCERIFGYTAEEAIGKDIRMLYPAELFQQEEEILSRVRQGEVVAVREVERVRKDGARIWLSVSVAPIRDELGRVVGATTIKRDISERKNAEAQERRQLVTRRLVRHVLRDIGARGGDSAATRRQLGRTMAGETHAKTLEDYLDALDAAGVGTLRLESSEPERYTLVGEGLLEVTPGYKEPTCHIALGYAEGAIGALHGRQALGSEIACQSKGHPQCRFVVGLR